MVIELAFYNGDFNPVGAAQTPETTHPGYVLPNFEPPICQDPGGTAVGVVKGQIDRE